MTEQSPQPIILITGGTGFAGSHLIEQLLQAGYTDIHATHFSPTKSYAHSLLPADHFHEVDLTDVQQCETLFAQVHPDQIYHLAALAAVGSSFAKTKQVLNNNIQLQLSVLEAMRLHTPQARMLVVGSAMEYDFTKLTSERINEQLPLGPASPYAVSKVMQDLFSYSYVQSYDLDIVRVRPFNHIGERQTDEFAIPAFSKQIALIEAGQQQVLEVGNLAAIRDFTDVKDMVRAYQLVMEKGQAGDVYNIGSGTGHRVQEVLDLLIGLSSAEITVKIDENRFRPIDIPKLVADPHKIEQLGWKANIPLEETLQRVLKYWRDQI